MTLATIGGIRKFDGYCPEPDAALADSAMIDRMN